MNGREAMVGRARSFGGRAARGARRRALTLLGADTVLGSPPPSTEAADDDTYVVPYEFVHQLLHELRTVELERLSVDGGRALSIGASGRWYFDWFEGAVGTVDEHIGVEAFEEMPDDLPDYVRWNTSTADRFDGVEDETVDIVFAGQTTEHLWASELTDFLLEAHRVLRPGATLVLDSPNRLVTQFMQWSHGEHTVELSADEIADLLDLAGFEVEICRGVLATRLDGRVLELGEGLERGDVAVRRVVEGPLSPDDSFIWWIVARRTAQSPNRASLLDAVERVFWTHWPTRISRGMWNPAETSTLPVPEGSSGPIASTFPFPIAAGTWALGLDIEGPRPADGVRVEILDIAGNPIHVLTGDTATPTEGRLTWGFEQAALNFACTLRIVAQEPDQQLTLRMPLDLRASSGKGVRAAG